MSYLNRHSLGLFGYYCTAAGVMFIASHSTHAI